MAVLGPGPLPVFHPYLRSKNRKIEKTCYLVSAGYFTRKRLNLSHMMPKMNKLTGNWLIRLIGAHCELAVHSALSSSSRAVSRVTTFCQTWSQKALFCPTFYKLLSPGSFGSHTYNHRPMSHLPTISQEFSPTPA
jgi:hypothetical protein